MKRKSKSKNKQKSKYMIPNINLIRLHHSHSRCRLRRWLAVRNAPKDLGFCAKFSKEDKNIYYIAARHDKKDTATFKLLRYFIKSNINLLLVEGIPFTRGVNPTRKKSIKKGTDEQTYAICTAKKYNISFRGLNMTKSLLYNELLTISSITKKDIILYIIMNWINHYKKNKPQKETLNMVKKIIHLECKKFNIKEFDFKKYYKQRLKANFNYKKIISSDPDPNGNIIQKLHYEKITIEDKHIIKNIYECIDLYDNIIIVFGRNHFYAHKDVLINTFGEPELFTAKTTVKSIKHI